jgi:UDP-N-acetylmuramoyl-L-alanyl-D-glutamate--2,6-diaminopimelate ligase
MSSPPLRKTLDRLVGSLGIDLPPVGEPVAISGIAYDSRQVEPGYLFVALAGVNSDGHAYIGEAIRRGAAAIAGTRPECGYAVPYIQVEDGRQALASLSAAFYDYPARQLTVIGVTGTDGKTTTTNLIYHILLAAGLPAGMISTVNAVIGELVLDTGFHVTTPEAPEVQRYLYEMVSTGLTHVVLEATSHGLSQKRVEACEFDLGVVTNITHEHLDFHGSYAAYRAAKARLFTSLAETRPKGHNPPRAAILNRDDLSYETLAELAKVRQISYGLQAGADVRANDIRHTAEGLQFLAVGEDFQIPVRSRLVGDFNVSNCLAAIAATVSGLGLDPGAAREGIAALSVLPGRMESIDLGQPFLAIVDFAHTPNALRRALQTARSLVDGRVIAVFGSAGLRDRAKRRLMAEVSAELADLTILTAEDPRSESLAMILADMAAGAESRGAVENQTFFRVMDRGEAISFAIASARPDDVVIACGKGHEQSMCFGEIEYPWDDRIAMRAALCEHLGIPGPQMPYLPTQER